MGGHYAHPLLQDLPTPPGLYAHRGGGLYAYHPGWFFHRPGEVLEAVENVIVDGVMRAGLARGETFLCDADDVEGLQVLEEPCYGAFVEAGIMG